MGVSCKSLVTFIKRSIVIVLSDKYILGFSGSDLKVKDF